MEINQLLSAIVEVSQSVTRMPSPPEEKEEVLEKIKTLFSCYNSIASLFARERPRERGIHSIASDDDDPTQVKQIHSSTTPEIASLFQEMEKKAFAMDEKLVKLEQNLSMCVKYPGQITDKQTSDLKFEFAKACSKIGQITTYQDDICNRVSLIENKSNDFEALKTKVDQLANVVENRSGVGSALANVQDELLKLHQEIAGLEGMVHNAKGKGTQNFVAFSACSLKNTSKYRAGQVIEFKDVQCNVNDCYDPIDDTFKNKFLGVYVFSTSINTNSAGNFEAAITLNGREVAFFGTPDSKDLQAATSTVLVLQPGDAVCIKVAEQMIAHGNVGVEVGGGFSNFIGYKIL